jgi:hypothetical protein
MARCRARQAHAPDENDEAMEVGRRLHVGFSDHPLLTGAGIFRASHRAALGRRGATVGAQCRRDGKLRVDDGGKDRGVDAGDDGTQVELGGELLCCRHAPIAAAADDEGQELVASVKVIGTAEPARSHKSCVRLSRTTSSCTEYCGPPGGFEVDRTQTARSCWISKERPSCPSYERTSWRMSHRKFSQSLVQRRVQTTDGRTQRATTAGWSLRSDNRSR